MYGNVEAPKSEIAHHHAESGDVMMLLCSLYQDWKDNFPQRRHRAQEISPWCWSLSS